MPMKKTEDFWTDTHSMEQAYRKIIHETNTFKEFNKDTERDSRYIKDKLEIGKDDMVLELGCGLGRLLAPISMGCKEAHGVDISGNILSFAEVYLKEIKGIGKLGLHVMPNSFTLPLENNQFDKAYSFIVLQHMNKYLAYANICELYRVLKVGGKVLLQFPDLRHQYREFLTHVEYHTTMTIPTARMYYYLKEELEIWFNMLKFGNVKIWEEGVDIWVLATK